MMTSSNGNVFRVTGPLCWEFMGEFQSLRPVAWSFDVFFDLRLNERLSKQSRRAHYKVTVMVQIYACLCCHNKRKLAPTYEKFLPVWNFQLCNINIIHVGILVSYICWASIWNQSAPCTVWPFYYCLRHVLPMYRLAKWWQKYRHISIFYGRFSVLGSPLLTLKAF